MTELFHLDQRDRSITSKVPEELVNAEKSLQNLFLQVLDHDIYVKEQHFIKEERIKEEKLPSIAKRLIWLTEHVPELEELHQSGVYINAHVYGFLVDSTPLSELEGMSKDEQKKQIAKMANDPDFKISTFFTDLLDIAQNQNILINIKSLYQQFGLSFSPDDCASVPMAYLKAEPQLVNRMIQFVSTAMKTGITTTMDTSSQVPPIRGRILYDSLKQLWQHNPSSYPEISADNEEEYGLLQKFGDGIRYFREYIQSGSDQKEVRFSWLDNVLLDSLVKWSQSPEVLTKNCLALNRPAIELIQQAARSIVQVDERLREKSEACDLMEDIIKHGTITSDIEMITHAKENIEELISLYTQTASLENAQINQLHFYKWAQIMHYPPEVRKRALNFFETRSSHYYTRFNESDFLKITDQMSKLEVTESKVISQLFDRYPHHPRELIVKVVQSTHFGIVAEWLNSPLKPSEYIAFERLLKHPNLIPQSDSEQNEYWFDAQDFRSLTETISCAWMYPTYAYEEEPEYKTNIRDTLERICAQSPDTAVLPHEGCDVGTDEIEGNSMFFVREEGAVVMYCKITNPFSQKVRSRVEQLPHEEVNFFETINGNRGKLKSVGYSTQSLQFRIDDCIVNLTDDSEFCLHAVKNSLRIEIPDIHDSETIYHKLAECMKQIGLSTDTLKPPSDEHEKNFKMRRFTWMHRREPNSKELLSLARKEVFPGYSTIVDKDFLMQKEVLPSELLLTHTTHNMNTVPSMLQHGIQSEYFAIRKGIPSLGMTIKPFNDMHTGFADNAGVRIYHTSRLPQTQHITGDLGIRLHLSPAILNRTDWYWYPYDSQGRVFDDIYENRPSADEAITAVKNQYNETNEGMFRIGISADDILFLSVNTPKIQVQLIEELHKRSITTIGGRPLEEAILVAETWGDLVEVYPQQVGERLQTSALIRLEEQLSLTDNYSPSKAIQILRENTLLSSYFDTVLSSSTLYGQPENYSLEQHTGMVLTNFERISEKFHENVLSRAGMRFALLIHDLGKGASLQNSQSQDSQNVYTRDICTGLLMTSGFSEHEKKVIMTLTSQDIFWQFLENTITKSEAAKQIELMAEEIDIPPIELFNLIKTYSLCDIAAYTKLASYIDSSERMIEGRLSLDHLIEMSEKGLRFNSTIEEKLVYIKSCLANTLASCNSSNIPRFI
ncbi:MAG: hypothetical protein ACOCXQ_03045 [Patescibacteria group bacterium]